MVDVFWYLQLSSLCGLQVIKSRPQFLKIATLSVVFCASVVGGNVSLRYLPVSFNQAVGATTPFFTAVFAYLMTFKREAWITYAALVPVVTGVIIASGVMFISLCSYLNPLQSGDFPKLSLNFSSACIIIISCRYNPDMETYGLNIFSHFEARKVWKLNSLAYICSMENLLWT